MNIVLFFLVDKNTYEFIDYFVRAAKSPNGAARDLLGGPRPVRTSSGDTVDMPGHAFDHCTALTRPLGVVGAGYWTMHYHENYGFPLGFDDFHWIFDDFHWFLNDF